MSTRRIARDIFAFLMVGCLLTLASEETKIVDDTNSKLPTQLTSTTTINFKKENRVTLLDQSPAKCFDVNFPIQILNPNGSLQVVKSDAALNKLIIDWFEQNPNSNNEPTFAYPFDITLADGQIIFINNEEQFLSIADACDEHILEENFVSVNTFCFDFIYPIQLIAPTGLIQKVDNADQVDKAILDWNAKNSHSDEELTVQFPIKIKFDDGIVISLEEVKGLSAAIQYCEDDDELEYEESYEEAIDGEEMIPIIGA